METNQLQRYAVCLDPLGYYITITGFSKKVVWFIQNEIQKKLPIQKFMDTFVLHKKRTKQENLDLYRKNFTHEPIEFTKKPKRVRTKERVYEVTKDDVTVEITGKTELIKHIGCKAQNVDMALRMDQKCLGYEIIEVSELYYEEE